MATKITALTNLNTLGVSLVKRGANKKTIVVTKSEGSDTMTINDVIKSLVDNGEINNEAKVVEVLKAAGMSDKGLEACKAALKILEGFADEPGMADAMKVLQSAVAPTTPPATPPAPPAAPQPPKPAAPTPPAPAAAQPPKPAAPAPAPHPAPAPAAPAAQPPAKPEEEKQMTTKTNDTPVFKSVEDMLASANVSAETKAQLEVLWKSQQEVVKKQADQITALEGVIKAEGDKRREGEWIAKANQSLKFIVGKSTEELGKICKSIEDKSGAEAAAQYFDLLKTQSDAIEKSSTLVAKGTQASGAPAGSAWDKIEELAKDIVAKSTGKMTHATAVDLVIKQNPELYKQYNAEAAARR